VNNRRLREQIGFYENELCNNILPFWVNNSLDSKYGGYFNCFDNHGRELVSRDKYTWSQGRFVWMWSKLAQSDCGTFTTKQKDGFLMLAKSGRDFLYNHCLISDNDFRCVFLMDETGSPKLVEGYDRYDMSIFADCFVTAAFARYALAAGDGESYIFSKKLYQSALDRLNKGDITTLPYPLSSCYRMHGIPMIFSNVTSELYFSAQKFEPGYIQTLKENLKRFSTDVLTNFVDDNYVLHEIVTSDNRFFPRLLGQHVNPGHTLEDMWFMEEAARILGNEEHWLNRLVTITKKTLELCWDHEYGGILHMCGVTGGAPQGIIEDDSDYTDDTDDSDDSDDSDEPMLKQTIDCWSDKLWWVHSEALYSTLLFYSKTGDETLLEWYDKIFGYTFDRFPNPDREIREWIQILKRDGTPQDKIVALPVKDPYHITRNLILIIELLYEMSKPVTG